MSDLVVTCPKDFWREWIAEGDAAGEPSTGEEWGWFGATRAVPPIGPGDRLYVVAWGRLRGFAPVTRLHVGGAGWCICREGGAEAITIDAEIPGFRGWRHRWWPPEHERAFPDWKTAGVGQRQMALQRLRT